MPRFCEVINDIQIIWGEDAGHGYFITVVDLLDRDEDTSILERFDTYFDGLKAEQIPEIAAYYGVDPVHVHNTLGL